MNPNVDAALRPCRLADFIAQARVKQNLSIAIEATRSRGDALDHVLLCGPAGLGKTTLAQIIARECGVNIKVTAAPLLEHKADLVAVLMSLQPADVLFIDEIHRLLPAFEEVLYPAMEDFRIDLVNGSRAQCYRLNKFTLIGATTRPGLITGPLRARFGIVHRLEFYSPADLAHVIERSAKILGIPIDPDAAMEIARRSRGTPRIANRLLRRVRDFVSVRGQGSATFSITRQALDALGIDEHGLDDMDRNLILTVIQKFGGGPVGLGTIAAALNEEVDAIEEVYEPYLMQLGLLDRTQRGRIATPFAYKTFGKPN